MQGSAPEGALIRWSLKVELQKSPGIAWHAALASEERMSKTRV